MVIEAKAAVKTQEAVNKFIEDCRYRDLSPHTIKSYAGHLKHFVLEFPEVPQEEGMINRFLTRVIKKKSARYNIRKTLLALYKYLQEHQGITNPIPLKSAGRPKKPVKSLDKSGRGGQTAVLPGLSSTFLSTRPAIDDFFASEDIKETTVQWYWGHFKRLIAAFPDVLPTKPEPLEHHISSIKGSPEHRHGSFRAIRALYKFLELRHRLPVDPQWGVQNPVSLINAPRVPRKVPASLSAAEFTCLFQATESDLERALVMLCADCGLRGGEISSLKVESIGYEFIKVTGKTGERQVSISPEVREMLFALAPKKTGYIFTGRFGQPLSVASLRYIVTNLLQRAGIAKRHTGTHLLRHSFGRNAIVLGADLVTVQELMGHQSITTTRKYTQLAQEEVHKIHQKTSPARQLFLGINGNNHQEGEDEPAPN